jgi:hypothetical protein
MNIRIVIPVIVVKIYYCGYLKYNECSKIYSPINVGWRFKQKKFFYSIHLPNLSISIK